MILNLVLAVVLEGASDHMKVKHAAQQFRESCLKLFHDQYKRLAMRRWAAKVRAEAMLEEGMRILSIRRKLNPKLRAKIVELRREPT